MSSFEGLSGFKDDIPQTGDDMMPGDKINFTGENTVSATARDPSKNENLQ